MAQKIIREKLIDHFKMEWNANLKWINWAEKFIIDK